MWISAALTTRATRDHGLLLLLEVFSEKNVRVACVSFLVSFAGFHCDRNAY